MCNRNATNALLLALPKLYWSCIDVFVTSTTETRSHLHRHSVTSELCEWSYSVSCELKVCACVCIRSGAGATATIPQHSMNISIFDLECAYGSAKQRQHRLQCICIGFFSDVRQQKQQNRKERYKRKHT